ncbi:hypothetical protein U3A58_16760 [Algoriphagus sp. C2-6-M1]|uniref:hypothetical protein n=1 Tax=Algoriphagus persicinus TaxID=3108754 RepID=UPI002B3F1C00|nr:hypothetical protein [Algoriphagus sp. C2-6-M1]MEB2782045.1 hypothetical protein [Algoriphagus sp. C2-6-M1]
MRKLDVVCLHDEFFTDHGFVFNQSQLFFEREFAHGKQVVFVHYVEGSKGNYLAYHVAIRINAVEELIQKYLPAPVSYAEQSITLTQTPHNLGNIYPQRMIISDENELSEVIHSAEDFFLKSGFHWLDQMIDPVSLEQEFLHQKENFFEPFNLVESAFRSTALSRLYNAKDYPVLRQFFLEKINSQEMTPYSIASFLKFLNYLDNLDNPVSAAA